jgi:hypothetical protein
MLSIHFSKNRKTKTLLCQNCRIATANAKFAERLKSTNPNLRFVTPLFSRRPMKTYLTPFLFVVLLFLLFWSFSNLQMSFSGTRARKWKRLGAIDLASCAVQGRFYPRELTTCLMAHLTSLASSGKTDIQLYWFSVKTGSRIEHHWSVKATRQASSRVCPPQSTIITRIVETW